MCVSVLGLDTSLADKYRGIILALPFRVITVHVANRTTKAFFCSVAPKPTRIVGFHYYSPLPKELPHNQRDFSLLTVFFDFSYITIIAEIESYDDILVKYKKALFPSAYVLRGNISFFIRLHFELLSP